MNDPMLPLPGLSSVSGKRVEVKFDGGLLSSDGGVLALGEVDHRLRVADRLAACMVDRRAPDQITHSLADIIRFRLLMIAAGYEDGNDANCLRSDPMFKMALDLTPSDRELCSQSTISRLVSHSSLDNECAARMKAWLASEGFENAFLDKDKATGIPPGADWEKTLYREIGSEGPSA